MIFTWDFPFALYCRTNTLAPLLSNWEFFFDRTGSCKGFLLLHLGMTVMSGSGSRFYGCSCGAVSKICAPPQLLPKLMRELGRLFGGGAVVVVAASADDVKERVHAGNRFSSRVCIVGHGVECFAVARTAYPLPPFNMTLLFGSK
jgi:hypothetical protein